MSKDPLHYRGPTKETYIQLSLQRQFVIDFLTNPAVFAAGSAYLPAKHVKSHLYVTHDSQKKPTLPPPSAAGSSPPSAPHMITTKMSKDTSTSLTTHKRNPHSTFPLPFTSHTTYKRDLHSPQKRPTFSSKETYILLKRDLLSPVRSSYAHNEYAKRDLNIAHNPQKRPTFSSKETYILLQRDLQSPLRSTYTHNEYAKRDLNIAHDQQKRPTFYSPSAASSSSSSAACPAYSPAKHVKSTSTSHTTYQRDPHSPLPPPRAPHILTPNMSNGTSTSHMTYQRDLHSPLPLPPVRRLPPPRASHVLPPNMSNAISTSHMNYQRDPHSYSLRRQILSRKLGVCARQICPQRPLYQMRPTQKTSKSNETYKRRVNQMCL